MIKVMTSTSLGRAVAAIVVPIFVSFCIGAFTLVWKLDKLTDKLTYTMESITAQVGNQDVRLTEIDQRLRLLEIEVRLLKEKRR